MVRHLPHCPLMGCTGCLPVQPDLALPGPLEHAAAQKLVIRDVDFTGAERRLAEYYAAD